MKQCYLDTEFNAFEYSGQNDGIQEVVEIGAVIMDVGSITDTFHTYCKIEKNHIVTKRCSRITGIKEETLVNAPSFPEACCKLEQFLHKHGIEKILTYGSCDRNVLEATGKFNKMGAEEFDFTKHITSVESDFRKAIDCGKFSWSMHDLSQIFHAENDKEHNALDDACTLALCAWKLSQQEIDWSRAGEILKGKIWKSGYKQNRRIKESVRNPRTLSNEQVKEIRSVLYACDAPNFVKDALFDDLLLTCGLQPEHENQLEV